MNSPEMADRLRVLRDHGATQKYHYECLGMNSRLDALQAAILRVKLGHLAERREARRQKAERYRSLFVEFDFRKQMKLPTAPPQCSHVYNQFTIRSSDRNRLREFLQGRDIPAEIYYPFPLHLQPAFAYLGYKPGQFPNSEAACREVLSLPIYPELKEELQAAVVRAIADFCGAAN